MEHKFKNINNLNNHLFKLGERSFKQDFEYRKLLATDVEQELKERILKEFPNELKKK